MPYCISLMKEAPIPFSKQSRITGTKIANAQTTQESRKLNGLPVNNMHNPIRLSPAQQNIQKAVNRICNAQHRCLPLEAERFVKRRQGWTRKGLLGMNKQSLLHRTSRHKCHSKRLFRTCYWQRWLWQASLLCQKALCGGVSVTEQITSAALVP